MSREIKKRGHLRALLFAVAALSTGFVHARMDTSLRSTESESAVPDPRQLRLAALGFESVVANYYWLQALQVVGEHRGDTERHAGVLARMVELVTGLDPWVDHPYRFAALWLTDSPESVRRANRLLERGILYHPHEWRNAYYLGFNRFFYLEENAQAADALARAAALPGSPNYLAALAVRLRSEQGGLELAEQALLRLLRETDDEYARAEYAKALDEIETERRARLLDAARYRFHERRGRDIESVSELLQGPKPRLSKLPPAHPIFPGFEWRLDPESREIESSFYNSRYQLHLHPLDRKRREQWRPQR